MIYHIVTEKNFMLLVNQDCYTPANFNENGFVWPEEFLSLTEYLNGKNNFFNT